MDPLAAVRVARSIVSGWVVRPSTPTRMVLAVTRRCNLRCATCRSSAAAPGADLTPAEAASLCAACPGLAWLDVTGGEPMMRRDAAEVFSAILGAAPSLGVLHFPTNGTFPDRAEAVARLVRRERPHVELIVTVSIDGPRELHDRLRGRSFERAVETWSRLRSIEGVRVYAGTTVSAGNAHALAATEAALATALPGFEARSWHWNLAIESGLFFDNGGMPDLFPPDPVAHVRAHALRRGVPRGPVDLMEAVFLANLHGRLSGRPIGFGCQALRTSCFVSADGGVYPCHVWDRRVGSLREEGFRMDRIWASGAALAARRGAERVECGGCFTPCEAYPAIAGAPVRAVAGAVREWRRMVGARAGSDSGAGTTGPGAGRTRCP